MRLRGAKKAPFVFKQLPLKNFSVIINALQKKAIFKNLTAHFKKSFQNKGYSNFIFKKFLQVLVKFKFMQSNLKIFFKSQTKKE